MKETERAAEASTRGALAREQGLIAEAIALVAGGDATRVTLAGLRFGKALLPVARALADDRRLTVLLDWHDVDSTVDITIGGRSAGLEPPVGR
jgi:hypothetical protein